MFVMHNDAEGYSLSNIEGTTVLRISPSAVASGMWALLTVEDGKWAEQVCDVDVDELLALATDVCEQAYAQLEIADTARVRVLPSCTVRGAWALSAYAEETGCWQELVWNADVDALLALATESLGFGGSDSARELLAA